MTRNRERAAARLLRALQGMNLLAAAGMASLLLYFLAASLACGSHVPVEPEPETPLNRMDSLAFEALVDANQALGVEPGGVRYQRSREGRIVAIHSDGPTSAQKLKTLPPDIGDLSALVTLDLTGHALASVTEELERLISLEQLHLSGNDLTSLPDGLRFERLRVVDLSSNALPALPGNFDVTRLEELDLHYNDIETLPPDFRWLTRLRRLDLGHNRLDSLPVDFSGMRDLAYLDLSLNRLRTLPESLLGLSPAYVNTAGNRICLHLDADPDSLEARQIEWLDRHDRDWRGSQRCE